MMKLITAIGTSDDHPNYLNGKIRISNQVALLMSLVGLFYTVFSIIFYPSLTIYPVFCIVLSLCTIGLNLIGWYDLSRFVLSTLVLLLAFIYHGFLVQPGEDIITSMYVIEFALSVIPWVLIDFREKPLLVFSLFACYFLIYSQSWANQFLVMELDSTLFRTGMLSGVSYLFAVMILVSCLRFMMIKNHNSEISNEGLLGDIHEKNKNMEKQQKELELRLDELRKARELEEKQGWVAHGIASITEIMRRDKVNVYTELLRATIKYVEANQGGIYLLHEEEEVNFLQLAACFAYDREKFIAKRIEIGQGLVGQCYLEKEAVILKEVPEDYITITSGLGDAPPTVIVILPLLHEKEVVGVMELALFHEIDEYQIEFLKKLSLDIASFVSSNTMNVQTRKLLEQSQQQMQQLKVHEEEMRQNMEELQATQEELERKEKEYLGRIAQMEQQLSES